MRPSLQQESKKLARSWMKHDPAWLRDYLVSGVEDPRLNLQSIFSRHFLLRRLTGGRFAALMREEYRFAAVMNWLAGLTPKPADAEELEALLYALRRGADNAEGTQIPQFVLQVFSTLPAAADGAVVPNYLESVLTQSQVKDGSIAPYQPSFDTFAGLWSGLFSDQTFEPITVLEPACGSANDYRFLAAYGLGRFLDYTGIDLCEANVANARAMFPGVHFEAGNVFALPVADQAVDVCVVHDLFEHLSLEGLETAVAEVCRVTRDGICAGFFQMHELSEHIVRVSEEYHLNTLSLDKVKDLFARHGFHPRVVNVGEFLRRQVGCEDTHNPNAYTLFLTPD